MLPQNNPARDDSGATRKKPIPTSHSPIPAQKPRAVQPAVKQPAKSVFDKG